MPQLKKDCERDAFKQWQDCLELYLEQIELWKGATHVLRELRFVKFEVTEESFIQFCLSLNCDKQGKPLEYGEDLVDPQIWGDALSQAHEGASLCLPDPAPPS